MAAAVVALVRSRNLFAVVVLGGIYSFLMATVLVARLEVLRESGLNPFVEWQIPNAVIALKQGAGRLIRSETDRGLLVVCDPRMAGMNYGRRLREALPPMTRVANEAEALAWLETLRN